MLTKSVRDISMPQYRKIYCTVFVSENDLDTTMNKYFYFTDQHKFRKDLLFTSVTASSLLV